MEFRPWQKRGYKTTDSTCVIGGYCEISGKPFIVSGNGELTEVLPGKIESELGVQDLEGIALFENDFLENINTGEVYQLRYNPEFPFSAIHPFAFEIDKNTKRLKKYKKILQA